MGSIGVSEVEVFRFNMDFEGVKKISESLMENRKTIDAKQVEAYANLVENGLSLCSDVYLNIKTNRKVDSEELIRQVIRQQNKIDDVEVEVLFGLELLEALNEKQEKVAITAVVNLSDDKKMMLFDFLHQGYSGSSVINKKKQLKLLSGRESWVYQVLEDLSTLDDSPLKGRIAMGGEDLLYRINPQSLSELIQRCSLLKRKRVVDASTFARLVINALTAYQSTFEEIYSIKKQPILKICDVRYVFEILPFLCQYAEIERKSLNVESLELMFGLIKKEGTDIKHEYKVAVKSDAGTRALARKHGELLVNKAVSYNPFEGLV